MTIDTAIREGQVLTGPLFSEPMRVETVRTNGPGSVEAGLVGQRTERFRRVTLTSDDIASLVIADPILSYNSDGSAAAPWPPGVFPRHCPRVRPLLRVVHLASGPATPPA